jgi:hypothetical protein
MITSLSLAYVGARRGSAPASSLLDQLATPSAPASTVPRILGGPGGASSGGADAAGAAPAAATTPATGAETGGSGSAPAGGAPANPAPAGPK